MELRNSVRQAKLMLKIATLAKTHPDRKQQEQQEQQQQAGGGEGGGLPVSVGGGNKEKKMKYFLLRSIAYQTTKYLGLFLAAEVSINF